MEKQYRPIRYEDDAEHNAAVLLRTIGYDDAKTTPPGADVGIDVVSSGLVAQVKCEMRPVGRPIVQQIVGSASLLKVQAAVFALRGYTQEALDWADLANAALFIFDLTGIPTPYNHAARKMMSAPDAVLRRNLPFLADLQTGFRDLIQVCLFNEAAVGPLREAVVDVERMQLAATLGYLQTLTGVTDSPIKLAIPYSPSEDIESDLPWLGAAHALLLTQLELLLCVGPRLRVLSVDNTEVERIAVDQPALVPILVGALSVVTSLPSLVEQIVAKQRAIVHMLAGGPSANATAVQAAN